jgi:hypothetical protein
MTLPEKPVRRKPRRLGLYAPFAALILAAAAWSLGWLWARDRLFQDMDAAAGAFGQAGYRIDWSGRAVSGYPFRLDLTITGPRLRETSGWGLAAPTLKAESFFLFGEGHWVIVAPAGVTLTRRVGGPVHIGARVLRASLSEASAHPPRLSAEGLDLAFAAAPGAAPFELVRADELHLHARSGPDDQGAFYLEIDRATTQGAGPLAQVAAGAPVTLIADAIYSHARALSNDAGAGPGLAGALASWSDAAGELAVRRLTLAAGPAGAEARSGTLAIGADGRLRGALALSLKSAPRLVTAMAGRGPLAGEASRAALAVVAAHDQGGVAAVTLHFQAGQTTLGPVAIGPAPRVY